MVLFVVVMNYGLNSIRRHDIVPKMEPHYIRLLGVLFNVSVFNHHPLHEIKIISIVKTVEGNLKLRNRINLCRHQRESGSHF